jgi:BirA family biotin operon repressor/biotin-[acetyl-CoA-carboxylase] ligase
LTDRQILVRALLRSFEELYGEWCADAGDPAASRLRDAYLDVCATLGREVRALLPGERELVGRAVDVDAAGRLVIRAEDGDEHAVSAGDVVHLRGV